MDSTEREAIIGAVTARVRSFEAAERARDTEQDAAKSTSCTSSRSRSSVVVPGLNEVVQGSTSATSSRPRVSACSTFACFPDEPRKMRGLFTRAR